MIRSPFIRLIDWSNIIHLYMIEYWFVLFSKQKSHHAVFFC